MRKDNGSSAKEYIYVGDQILAMYNPATNTWTDRIYGPTGALATVPGTASGSPVYRAADHLGSLSYTLDATGNITGVSSTLAYRQLTATATDTFPFTNHERDDENGRTARMRPAIGTMIPSGPLVISHLEIHWMVFDILI